MFYLLTLLIVIYKKTIILDLSDHQNMTIIYSVCHQFDLPMRVHSYVKRFTHQA